MEYQNLSTNTHANLAIFYKTIDKSIYQDIRYSQLMDILKEYPMINYAFYSDSIIIKDNIFIPLFHTMYLANSINSVVLEDEKDFWITDIFTHNKYYIIRNQDADYSKMNNINLIDNLREII